MRVCVCMGEGRRGWLTHEECRDDDRSVAGFDHTRETEVVQRTGQFHFRQCHTVRKKIVYTLTHYLLPLNCNYSFLFEVTSDDIFFFAIQVEFCRELEKLWFSLVPLEAKSAKCSVWDVSLYYNDSCQIIVVIIKTRMIIM